jgi:hypothetical protein
MNKKISFANVVLIVLFLFGCTPKKDNVLSSYTNEQIKSFVMHPGKGFGPITFQSSSKDVESILGTSERQLVSSSREYPSIGIAILIDKKGKINSFLFGNSSGSPNDSLVQACQFKTAEGIGMMSNRAEIITAYGDPSASQNLSTNIEELQYKNIGARFVLNNDSLVWMGFSVPKV